MNLDIFGREADFNGTPPLIEYNAKAGYHEKVVSLRLDLVKTLSRYVASRTKFTGD